MRLIVAVTITRARERFPITLRYFEIFREVLKRGIVKIIKSGWTLWPKVDVTRAREMFPITRGSHYIRDL